MENAFGPNRKKNAVYYLQRYSTTKSESHYNLFLEELKIPLGDHQTRIEIEKPVLDHDAITKSFLQERIHSNDINQIVNLVRRFHDAFVGRGYYDRKHWVIFIF